MLDSLKKSSYQRIIDHAGGVYDIRVFTRDIKSFNKLIKDPILTKTSTFINLGTYKIPNTKYTLEINGYDKNIGDFINFKLEQGRYPENNNEIAIEDWMLDKFPVKYKIGNKISFPTALSRRGLNGKREELKVQDKFTIVGVFKYTINQNTDKNKAVAYVKRKYVESKLPLDWIEYEAYADVNPENSAAKSLELLASKSDYVKVTFNQNYFKTSISQDFKAIDFISIILYIFISIVASVIIYNIFNVSVTERVKEFGMLRAIGSSPGQIKLLVLGEGLILGCIFIPIGILLGNFIVKGIIALTSGYKDFNGIINIPMSGIAASFIVGFLSILIGTIPPAGKASKISPIEAISSNNNLQLTGRKINKKLQNNSIVSKFGFTADMGYLNLKRNRKRYITTVISLSISIVMFLFVNYLINSTDPIKNLKSKIGGDFIIVSSSSQPKDSLSDKDIEDIKDIKGIDQIYNGKTLYTAMIVPEGKITKEGMKLLQQESNKSSYAKQQLESKIYKFSVIVNGYSKDELNSMKGSIVEGKINAEDMDESPVVILVQNLNYSSNTRYNAGDKLTLMYYIFDDKGNFIRDDKKTFTIAAILKEDLISPDAQIKNLVFMRNETAEKYLDLKGYQQIKITLSKNADYEGIEKTLKAKIKNYRGVTLTSYKEELEKTKKSNMQTSLIMYSFVIVITIVSIINLFNIMSMNIMLRKKEIGMLRAIGFENNQVKEMIRFEGMFYGLASGFWGTVTGVILTYFSFLISRRTLNQGMTWSFPIITVIMTFGITIFICLLSSINASRQLFSSSIVESIRGNE